MRGNLAMTGFVSFDGWVTLFIWCGAIRATPGSPAAEVVKLAYSDNILHSLPILSQKSDKKLLVDLTPTFMQDLPEISQEMDDFEFAAHFSLAR